MDAVEADVAPATMAVNSGGTPAAKWLGARALTSAAAAANAFSSHPWRILFIAEDELSALRR
jgi:hypothetical protein